MDEMDYETEPAEAAEENGGPTPAPQAAPERKHRATYARDNRNGGYLIRIAGPYPEKFAGREVPVVLRSGKEHLEKVTRLIWTGNDKDTNARVALYAFEAKPRGDVAEELAF